MYALYRIKKDVLRAMEYSLLLEKNIGDVCIEFKRND